MPHKDSGIAASSETVSLQKKNAELRAVIEKLRQELAEARSQATPPPKITPALRLNKAIPESEMDPMRWDSHVVEGILESTLAGFCDWRIPENKKYMSPSFKAILGYRENEIADEPGAWETLVHPEDLPVLMDKLQVHVASGGQLPYESEARYLHKKGHIVWIYCRGKVIEWGPEGQPLRMIGSHLDISPLKTIEEQLISVFEKSPLIKIVVNAEGVVQMVNERAVHKLGWEKNVLLGKPVSELIADIAPPALRNQNGEGAIESWFTTIVTRFSRNVPVEVYSSNYQFHGKVLTNLVLVDLTERRRLETELEKSHMRFQLAVEGTRDGIWEWRNISEDQEWWSPQYYRLLGYKEGEIEANFSTFKSMLHPEDLGPTLKAVDALFEHDVPYDVEYRLRKKTGDYNWFRARTTLVRDEAGNPHRMVGSLSDIQYQKDTEERLAQQEAYIKELYAISATPNLSLSEKIRRVLEVGDRALEMPLGVMAWVRGDLIDVYQTVGPWEQMPVGNSLTLKDSYTELAIQAGGMIAIENVGQSPYASSGAYQKLGLESIIFKTLEFNGTVYGTLGFIDLNPHEHPFNEFEKDFIRLMGEWVSFVIRQEELEILQKKQTEDLARSNRELQQFAYVASHDLQEPLRMITSYSQLFAKRYQEQLDEKADRYITYIIEGGARMKNLLDTLLKYSRLGNMERNEARFDGKKMVETALTNLAVLIQESRAGIRIGDIPEIWGDESQLTLVIQNLVANAIKFVRDKTPNVQIEAEVSGKYWCFSVRDNGIGIAPEHRKRVFEVFERLNSREEFTGTGMGLAICKKIVEQHEGDIWVAESSPEGTVIKFTLGRK